ncbi:MAG: hypothetical protein JXR77_13385 [Lentisphaeria bacterium]|nr:hypothetical protein [Lentisphaeria bacterium]
MAFQLHIRHNLESARDGLGRGDMGHFTRDEVRVGSAPECECCVEDEAFPPLAFVLRSEVVRGVPVTQVAPTPGSGLFLNGVPATETLPLRSGDELRLGHWTMRFHRVHGAAGRTWSFELLAVFGKVLVGLILVAEVGIVTWLPRRLHRAAVWEHEVSRQRVAQLLDSLRRENQAGQGATAIEQALRRTIARELDRRALYLARHGGRLGPAQNRAVHEELLDFQRILSRLGQGPFPPPYPGVDMDGAVRALLRRYGEVADAP